jgi:hypothetical protein|tara:strand:- start:288 stop:533 length:246 start_codon:yes stop_codon:yes gene_type:complete
MVFENNVDKIFAINKHAQTVIKSCIHLEHIEGARNYVNNLERLYSTVECKTKKSKDYLETSLVNIKALLNAQHRKLKLVNY